MIRFAFITTSAASIILSIVGRLTHSSFVEAVRDHEILTIATVFLFVTGCAIACVVSRFFFLNDKIKWLERSIGKIAENRDRYKALVNSINDFIVIIDNEGYILFSNVQAKKWIGLDHENLVGGYIDSVLNKPAVQNDAVEGDGSFFVLNYYNGEFLLSGAEGEERWVSCRSMPLQRKDGDVQAFILIMRDITELKYKEQELITARDMAEEGNRIKGAFLANMSHELRTPLSSILGYSQLMEMQKIGTINEKQKQYLRYILSSGEHLLEMVNDVLDLSKIDAGKLRIEKKQFNMNLMLARSPSTIKVIADKKKVDMILNIQPNLGLLDADEVRVKQVIYNLLSNAIKFTESGKRVGIDAYASGETVVISVWDEGCGIAQEDLERIFLPFEQAKGKEGQGTGLGLSIVKKLVNMHSGAISVQSTLGVGSRFTVTIPGRLAYQPQLPTIESIIAAEPTATAYRKVLIVEDNDTVAELVRSILDVYGFDAITIRTGEDALQRVGSGTAFDLVLVDIGLPGMSGVDLIKKLKETMNPHVPIIALTGYAMKGDRERFLDFGFDDYISKPIEIESFISKVKNSILH